MGFAKRIDRNQNEIVQFFRNSGFSVAITSGLGAGFPDVVLGFQGCNFLVEIKDGNKPPSAQKLTDAESKFFDQWKGQVCIINSIEAAINLVNEIRKLRNVELLL